MLYSYYFYCFYNHCYSYNTVTHSLTKKTRSNKTKVGTVIGGESCTQGCGDPHYFWCGPGSSFHFDAVPDPTFHFDADPDPDQGPAPNHSDANLQPPWTTDPSRLHFEQEVTRRCRLSWLTDSALVWAQMREEGWGDSAVHRSTNKLCRSNSVFSLWF